MTKDKWHDRPMRIAALQCNFEGDKTLDVVDKWVDMHFNVEQLFHPMADMYSALFDEEKHSAILLEYIEKAHKNGIRIILYMNVHILGPSLEKHGEDWCQRRRDGSPIKLYDDVYYSCCVNGGFKDYYLSAVDRIGQFDLDGIFLDGPGINSAGCFCRSCRERCRNEFGVDLEDVADAFEFYRRSKSDFLRQSYERLKKSLPDAVHYMNFPLLHASKSFVSIPDARKYNDIMGTEGGFMFYGRPRESYLWKVSRAARALEAVAPEKPRVIFIAGDQKPWSWYMHTPVQTQLCIASTSANAANIWYGLHGSTKLLETPGAVAASEMLGFMARNEDAYYKTRSAARVAVMYSFSTERFYSTTAEASDFYGAEKKGEFHVNGNFTAAFDGICETLFGAGIPFDVTTDLEEAYETFDNYECIILPTCACLSDAAIAALEKYVGAGGRLIASFETASFDDTGKKREKFPLSSLFGLDYSGSFTKYGPFNYFSKTNEDAVFEGIGVPYIPAPDASINVEPSSGRVVAMFYAPFRGRYAEFTELQHPALIRNTYGKGETLFMAGSFGENLASFSHAPHRTLLRNALRMFAPSNPELSSEGGNIEMVVRKRDNRLFIHLINYLGAVPRPFEKIAPQHNISIRLPGVPAKCAVKALSGNSGCRTESDDESLTIRLDKLELYEVVEVEI